GLIDALGCGLKLAESCLDSTELRRDRGHFVRRRVRPPESGGEPAATLGEPIAQIPEPPQGGREPQGQLTVGYLCPTERSTEVVELALDLVQSGALRALEVTLELLGESDVEAGM